MTKEQILKEINSIEYYMYIKEIADDFYYTKGTYEEDRRKLEQLRKMLKELK